MTIRTQDRDGVRVLTIDNPPINALSFALSAELRAATEAAESDPSVRAVVFTGAGTRAFCSGGNTHCSLRQG